MFDCPNFPWSGSLTDVNSLSTDYVNRLLLNVSKNNIQKNDATLSTFTQLDLLRLKPKRLQFKIHFT